MPIARKLLVLPGDGIGPEVIDQVCRVIKIYEEYRAISFDTKNGLVGGVSYDELGTPLSDETLEDALEADAVLLGAVGGAKWDNVERQHRPEAGLLRLRKEMGLFANLRPATCVPALAGSSSLKSELVSGLDLLIVRELTGGVYFGEPRGITDIGGGEKRAVDTQIYTSTEIRRVLHIAMEMASKREKKVHSVEKANVMETGVLWRQIATSVGEGYPDIALEHMYADNCAMQLVRNPKQFDVIVTDNLFGDLLSDCAAMLTGSLGMLPSASLGEEDSFGRRKALYEPVHGSAPDIEGQGKANPIATILSFAMCLRYTFDLDKDAKALEQACADVLDAGLRTADIMQEGKTLVSTEEIGEEVCLAFGKLL